GGVLLGRSSCRLFPSRGGRISSFHGRRVDFARRPPPERAVRPMLVIPKDVRGHQRFELARTEPHAAPSKPLRFQRKKEAFHDGNGAVFTHGAEAWLG